MKRPTTVRVGLHRVKITWSDKKLDRLQSAEIESGDMEAGETLFGRWHPSEMTIYVRKSGDESVLRETLMHELLHCIVECFGVVLTKEEEQTVRALSPNLVLVMQQNPRVRNYIFGGDGG